MRRLGWYLGVPVAASVGGAAGAWTVLPLGLGWTLAIPLALFFGALSAGLCAAWVGNLTAMDGMRSRLPVVLVFATVSVVGADVVVPRLSRFLPLSLFLVGILIFAVVGLGTSFAVWRFRAERGALGWSGGVTLALAGVWAVVLFLTSPAVDSDVGLRKAILGPYRAAGYGGATEWAVAASLLVALAGVIWVVWLTVGSVLGREIKRDAVGTLALVGLTMPVFILMLYLFPPGEP